MSIKYHMPFRTNSTMVGFGNWDTDNDIFFVFKLTYDITHNKYNFKPDEATSGELLLNSTFAGGGGPSSYRFQEALDVDAIPVASTYVALP